MTDDEGLRARLTRQGEDALGRFAQELLENPYVSGAIQRAFEAREKAVQAQEVAMGALNLPSAADLERLTRRIRSVAQRLEGIEDGLDRLDERIAGGDPSRLEQRLLAIEADLERIRAVLDQKPKTARSPATERRLGAIERQLESIATDVAELRRALPEPAAPLPRGQERIRVEEAAG
jgi:DNA repair exonuclease SbcCD ATPase subunit